jgi:hypothetical protein
LNIEIVDSLDVVVVVDVSIQSNHTQKEIISCLSLLTRRCCYCCCDCAGRFDENNPNELKHFGRQLNRCLPDADAKEEFQAKDLSNN